VIHCSTHICPRIRCAKRRLSIGGEHGTVIIFSTCSIHIVCTVPNGAVINLPTLLSTSSNFIARSDRRGSISKSRRRTRVSVFILHGDVFGLVILVARRIPRSNFCTKQIFYRRCPAYQCCLLPSGVLKVQTYRHAIGVQTDGDRHYGVCCNTRQYDGLCHEGEQDEENPQA
jgi:hypothetical protein